MDVSTRLIQLREARGYTTNRLANLAGISQSFLRDIEHQKKRPTVDTLSLLCDALGVSLHEFFNEDPFLEEDDAALLRLLHRLSPIQRRSLLAFLNTL